MSAAGKPRATVHTERNEGIQIGEHHEDVDTKNGTNLCIRGSWGRTMG